MKTSLSSRVLLYLVESGYSVDAAGSVRNPSGVVLSSPVNKRGYRCISVRVKALTARKLGVSPRRTFSLRVGRLQAYQKFGLAALRPMVVVRHGKLGPADDSAGNIEIGSQSDNMLDVAPEVRRAKARTAARCQRRFTDEQVRNLRVMRAAGATLQELGGAFGIGKGHVSDVVNRKLYSDVL